MALLPLDLIFRRPEIWLGRVCTQCPAIATFHIIDMSSVLVCVHYFCSFSFSMKASDPIRFSSTRFRHFWHWISASTLRTSNTKAIRFYFFYLFYAPSHFRALVPELINSACKFCKIRTQLRIENETCVANSFRSVVGCCHWNFLSFSRILFRLRSMRRTLSLSFTLLFKMRALNRLHFPWPTILFFHLSLSRSHSRSLTHSRWRSWNELHFHNGKLIMRAVVKMILMLVRRIISCHVVQQWDRRRTTLCCGWQTCSQAGWTKGRHPKNFDTKIRSAVQIRPRMRLFRTVLSVCQSAHAHATRNGERKMRRASNIELITREWDSHTLARTRIQTQTIYQFIFSTFLCVVNTPLCIVSLFMCRHCRHCHRHRCRYNF